MKKRVSKFNYVRDFQQNIEIKCLYDELYEKSEKSSAKLSLLEKIINKKGKRSSHGITLDILKKTNARYKYVLEKKQVKTDLVILEDDDKIARSYRSERHPECGYRKPDKNDIHRGKVWNSKRDGDDHLGGAGSIKK